MTFITNAFADYAQQLMNRVQSNALSASFTDGITRNARPYFAFGDVAFGEVPNACPSVRMRSGDFEYMQWRFVGGLGESGTEGTLYTEFIAHVVGTDEDSAFQEVNYLMFAIRSPFADEPPTALFYPYPTISDVKVTVLDTGQLQKNAKRGYEVRWKAPVSFQKVPITTTVTLLTASVSSSFSGSSMMKTVTITSGSLSHGVLK